MKEERLNPSTLPKPPAFYCQVVRKGGLVTPAGMVSQNADGEGVGEGDIEIQTRQGLENLKIALGEVGASFKDIVKTTIFLSDMTYYKGMNTVFNEYFEGKTTDYLKEVNHNQEKEEIGRKSQLKDRQIF